MAGEKEFIERAKEYLKKTYHENTLAFKITKNGVKDGTGILEVDCEVDGIYAGKWHKWFHFQDGRVEDMDASKIKNF